jgi:P-loop containing dynein motor region
MRPWPRSACLPRLLYRMYPTDARMDKRRKGVFGPPLGSSCVCFVDDLNMPARERYYAQPPLELLRQFFDHGGWYERRPPCAFRSIVDTQIVGAMGPPGGGRNPVSARVLRHFNMLAFPELSDTSMGCIFSTLLGNFLRRHFAPQVASMADQVSSRFCAQYALTCTAYLSKQRHCSTQDGCAVLHSVSAPRSL